MALARSGAMLFAGMYRASGAEIARPPYSVSQADRGLDGVPIAVWSAKNLETEWEGHATNLVDDQLKAAAPAGWGGACGTTCRSRSRIGSWRTVRSGFSPVK